MGWAQSSRCHHGWGGLSLRPILSLSSEATLTGQSPADAETPQTHGQEGGHGCSGAGRAELFLETDRLAKGLVHGRILVNIGQMEAWMNSDVKESFLVSLVSEVTPVGTWQDDIFF